MTTSYFLITNADGEILSLDVCEGSTPELAPGLTATEWSPETVFNPWQVQHKDGQKLRLVNGAPVWQESRTIEQVKAAKAAWVNSAREVANASYFTFAGRQISVDRLGKDDISGVSQEVALTGALPANFPGGWKTVDNSYVAIPDVATWRLFIQAMVAQGTANFLRAQTLKAQIALAETFEDIEAIQW